MVLAIRGVADLESPIETLGVDSESFDDWLVKSGVHTNNGLADIRS